MESASFCFIVYSCLDNLLMQTSRKCVSTLLSLLQLFNCLSGQTTEDSVRIFEVVLILRSYHSDSQYAQKVVNKAYTR